MGITLMLHVEYRSWVLLKKPLPGFLHYTARLQSCLALTLGSMKMLPHTSIWKSDCASTMNCANLAIIWLRTLTHVGSFLFLGSECIRCLWAVVSSFSWTWGWESHIYFEDKIRNWPFQSWFWEGRVFVTPVTKWGNDAQEKLKESHLSQTLL